MSDEIDELKKLELTESIAALQASHDKDEEILKEVKLAIKHRKLSIVHNYVVLALFPIEAIALCIICYAMLID